MHARASPFISSPPFVPLLFPLYLLLLAALPLDRCATGHAALDPTSRGRCGRGCERGDERRPGGALKVIWFRRRASRAALRRRRKPRRVDDDAGSPAVRQAHVYLPGPFSCAGDDGGPVDGRCCCSTSEHGLLRLLVAPPRPGPRRRSGRRGRLGCSGCQLPSAPAQQQHPTTSLHGCGNVRAARSAL